MRIIPCEQGTKAWADARIGIPTASRFDSIITPKTMKPSASAAGYLHEKLAEWMLGACLDDAVSSFMERGIQIEEEAADFYEFSKDVEARRVGFIVRDDGKVGCSPDRLVGDDGLLEIKCPAAKTHVGYLLGNVAEDYRCQVQGQLYVSEREWCDVLSYCPGLPPALVRVERDKEFIAALSSCVNAFVGKLDVAKAEMIRRGFTPKVLSAA